MYVCKGLIKIICCTILSFLSRVDTLSFPFIGLFIALDRGLSPCARPMAGLFLQHLKAHLYLRLFFGVGLLCLVLYSCSSFLNGGIRTFPSSQKPDPFMNSTLGVSLRHHIMCGLPVMTRYSSRRSTPSHYLEGETERNLSSMQQKRQT